ncbi:hypothetical protein [Jeotgalibacillus soli]|uniref:Uncharacterized protein n=1 Tax=Jeotgalibacillus soli TaxID=889306 RepID=A0A0C2W798_9BACL|nr:hypothetical protein [Jeotgalibacillus soli]KIL51913.1 hypothetical protein KP78_02830 [Jeotgalibacillus soli]
MIDKKAAPLSLLSYIKPLPALKEIANWSQVADIYLLSNHCSEWIAHILKPINHHVKSITISSQVGSLKPHPTIYSKIKAEDNLLFIDDQPEKLKIPLGGTPCWLIVKVTGFIGLYRFSRKLTHQKKKIKFFKKTFAKRFHYKYNKLNRFTNSV